MNGYITLDYELGMGNATGTPERCLLEPMEHLTAMTDKYGIKMNVFVDAAYILQMRNLKDQYLQLQKDYNTVTNHIRKLDSEGHSIQLHLHPQWCYSSFNGDKWILDKDHYKLRDMPLEEQKQLIVEGTKLLNSLINGRVTAFRAGGYSLDNYSELYKTFVSVGIKNETSVLRGAFQQGKFQQYDYRSVPPKTSYLIEKSLTIEDENGSITEFPINTKNIPYIIHFFKKYCKPFLLLENRDLQLRWGDGYGIGYPGTKLQKMMKQVGRIFSTIPMRACIDECYSFEKVYNYSLKHYIGEDFIIIGHPKLISPKSVALFEGFIKNHSEINYKLF